MNTWNWLERIQKEMAEHGESFDDVVASVPPKDMLLEPIGYFGTGKPFTVWTTHRVYFPAVYDGSEWCSSVARNPDGLVTCHVGSGKNDLILPRRLTIFYQGDEFYSRNKSTRVGVYRDDDAKTSDEFVVATFRIDGSGKIGWGNPVSTHEKPKEAIKAAKYLESGLATAVDWDNKKPTTYITPLVARKADE